MTKISDFGQNDDFAILGTFGPCPARPTKIETDFHRVLEPFRAPKHGISGFQGPERALKPRCAIVSTQRVETLTRKTGPEGPKRPKLGQKHPKLGVFDPILDPQVGTYGPQKNPARMTK